LLGTNKWAQYDATMRLVSSILAAKAADSVADKEALEREFHTIVYKVYGLTDEGIAIVEGRTRP
jgi:hypothetical protein